MSVSVPCVAFLDAYPHPAFVLPHSQAVPGVPIFRPVYANPSYKSFIALSESSAANQEFLLVESLESNKEVGKLASHLLRSPLDPDKSNLLLRFRPHWLSQNHGPIELEITCTRLEEFCLCTSVPRSQLMLAEPLLSSVTLAPGADQLVGLAYFRRTALRFGCVRYAL